MSLANIESRLSQEEMFEVMAGSFDWGAFCIGIEAAALLCLGTNPILNAMGFACFTHSVFTK